MNKIPYSDKPSYSMRKAVEDINEKISKEEENLNPDAYKLNKLKEERYMPGLFSDVMGYYDRFRNPW